MATNVMSNTQLRVISALVLVAIVVASVILGKVAFLTLVGVVGVLVLDEFIVNFLNSSRKTLSYGLAIASFIAGYSYINGMKGNEGFFVSFNNAGLVLDGLMLIFLFFSKRDSKKVARYLKSVTFLLGLLFLIPFMNLTALVQAPNWIYLISALAVLNFSVDTGAWFFGKNFGSRKLWPAVSPNKTIEGFIGGVLSSVIITSSFWYVSDLPTTFQVIISFIIIACCSQLGDLVQSKMKRQFNIKDSSNLIPGHGGMYDRVDSLLFVAPLFVFVVRLLPAA